MRDVLSSQSKGEILNICRELAFPYDIVAASFYGPHICGYADEKSDLNVLLIIKSPKSILKCHIETINETNLSLLMVDQKTFELDVKEDRLGGLLVENILIPYESLVNGDYLWDQEVEAKKRIVIEILGNLVLEFPQMSHELLVKPEFFMFEAMMRKASLFPPITYRFLNMLRSESRERNQEFMMRGFTAALEVVGDDGCLTVSDEYVKISKDYINAIQRRRLRVVNFFRIVRSGILRHTFKIFPGMMRSFMEDYRLYNERFKESLSGIPLFRLEDPDRYIFIPTPLGPISLSDKITIEDFVRRTVPNGQALEVNIGKLGGVLNTVYMLNFQREAKEQKIVVKVFKEWYGWKWFPLALWALGTRGFAVRGKSRLEKEYATNRFLSDHDVHVPRIIYISPKERLIFEEYVDGANLAKMIKQICESEENRSNLTKIIKQVGRQIAKVHELGVAIGDCKAENIIITADGEIYFVDLEQAERGGDQAWDIAEFLYYSSHYASPSSVNATETLTRELIEGYLEAGGKTENVKKIGSPRYVKVFSFFTPPHLIFATSNVCKEILKSRSVEKL